MSAYQICGDISRTVFYGHVMKCVGRRGEGEVRDILGGGMKRLMGQC